MFTELQWIERLLWNIRISVWYKTSQKEGLVDHCAYI